MTRIYRNTRDALTGLGDILFPPLCLSCTKLLVSDKKVPLCPECDDKIIRIIPPFCQLCGAPLTDVVMDPAFCPECQISPPPFKSARALGRYDGLLRELIHRFKYGGDVIVGDRLGQLMSRHCYRIMDMTALSVIIPVPLHPRRLRERGFNQAVLLSKHFAARWSIPLDALNLMRSRYTLSQTNLDRDSRFENVRGCFHLKKCSSVQEKNVLLIDDVYTTGSTVKECAGVLMANGAASVSVVTLARTSSD